uniref:Major facilitator superfamily associated domain-containing protein n=1 Tax=Timema genevievae TaxID=629358 RepID=A0A7R9PS53_TIMGE|nr:unnamed protein product [Timema genevievae]
MSGRQTTLAVGTRVTLAVSTLLTLMSGRWPTFEVGTQLTLAPGKLVTLWVGAVVAASLRVVAGSVKLERVWGPRFGKSQRDITLCLTIVDIGCFPDLDTLREEYPTPKTARSLKTPTSVLSTALYVLYPYLTIHMRELGINVEETAIMSAVTPIVAIVMPPLAGMVADRIGDFKASSQPVPLDSTRDIYNNTASTPIAPKPKFAWVGYTIPKVLSNTSTLKGFTSGLSPESFLGITTESSAGKPLIFLGVHPRFLMEKYPKSSSGNTPKPSLVKTLRSSS